MKQLYMKKEEEEEIQESTKGYLVDKQNEKKNTRVSRKK